MSSAPEIYDPQSGPFVAWLHCSGDKREFTRVWHDKILPSRTRGHLRILDMGCGAGHTALMLIRALKARSISFEYLGVSPHSEQVSAFNTTMCTAGVQTRARAVEGTLDSFQADGPYGIVIANHSLYYVDDLSAASRKLMQLGREVVIAHHGQLGIDQIHRALPGLVNDEAQTVSTYHAVLRHLPTGGGAPRRARIVEVYRALIDVRSCLSPWDPVGEQLMGFMLNRPPHTISPGEFQQVRRWLGRHASTFLTHEVGVLHLR